MNEDLFADWINPEDLLALEAQFLMLEKNQQTDPFHRWRIEVNLALANEGINITWPDQGDEEMHSYVVVQPIITDHDIKDFEKIPVIHLKELFEHEGLPANPRAVAAYIKAILYDKRFRLWQYEKDDLDFEST